MTKFAHPSRIAAMVLTLVLLFAGCTGKPRDDLRELNRIDALLSDGGFKNTKSALKDYVTQYPQSYKAWSLWGWAHLKTGSFHEADDCFNRSLSINPQWDNAYVGKGVLSRKQGDLAAARDHYQKAVDLEPENAEAFTSLLVIELLSGNDPQAIAYGLKAWKRNKTNPVIPANLAIAYHMAGDSENRNHFFDEAQRLNYYNIDKVEKIFDGELAVR